MFYEFGIHSTPKGNNNNLTLERRISSGWNINTKSHQTELSKYRGFFRVIRKHYNVHTVSNALCIHVEKPYPQNPWNIIAKVT